MSDEAPPWLSEDEFRVWYAFMRASVLLDHRMDADLRRFGLDLGEYEILVTLSAAPEQRVRMSELAAAVHQSRSRLTHTIARMERAELVWRGTCPVDRRGVWAHLTDGGRTLLQTAAPAHVTLVRKMFVEAIEPADYQAVGRAFSAVLRAANEDKQRMGA